VGSAYDYASIVIAALLLILADIVWLVFAYKVVTVKRIDDRHVWLTGLDEQYLLQFPPWPSGSPRA